MDHITFRNSMIDAISCGLITASEDYFRRTNGRYLYDRGVESILQHYCAAEIEERMKNEHNYCIELEHRTIDIFGGNLIPFPFRSGRIDLYVRVGINESQCLVEFKRYLNPAVIRDDIERLSKIVNYFSSRDRPTIGMVCGVMYQASGYNNNFLESYPKLIDGIVNDYKGFCIGSVIGKNSDIFDRGGQVVIGGKFDRHLPIITTIEKL